MAEEERSDEANPRRRQRRFANFSFLRIFLATIAVARLDNTMAALLQGCDFGDELCDRGELCVPDGLFGQCYSDEESTLLRPLILDRTLSDFQTELLRSELTRLAALGLDWPDARAQCVLAYFKLAVAFQLDYDTEFCTVRNPRNIWALVQRVQNVLLAEEEATTNVGEDEGQSLLVESPKDSNDDEKEVQMVGASSEEEEGPVVIPIVVMEEEEDGGEDGKGSAAAVSVISILKI